MEPVNVLLESELNWEEVKRVQLGSELTALGGKVAHDRLLEDC